MLTKMLIIKKVVCQCTFTLVHICIISSWLQCFSTCIQVPGGYWEIAECYVYEFKLDHVSSSKNVCTITHTSSQGCHICDAIYQPGTGCDLRWYFRTFVLSRYSFHQELYLDQKSDTTRLKLAA